MSQLSITPNTVRLLLLHVQGLLHPPRRPAEKPDVLDAIRRMGMLQIDTINVVARSPYLVLWSRLGSYNPAWLDELLAEGRLFEYWSHAACFLPIEDYPLYRSKMSEQIKRNFSASWIERNSDLIQRILEHVRSQGEVRSSDFERKDGKSGGWWDWKDEKLALEYLHTAGELMIARREKFQRIYDLRSRVFPEWEDSQTPTLEETRDELTIRAVRLLGAAPARWIPDYFRMPKTGLPARLKRLVDAGQLLEVDVQGWNEVGYIHPENLSLLEWAAGDEMVPTYTTLLSPFDPLVWDRERAKALFNFEYTIECYLPEAKRRYGYFTLPILHEGQLIGRLDAKAHRKEGIFEVKALHLEPRARLAQDVAAAVGDAIQRCAQWHNTQQVIIRRSEPENFASMLNEHIEHEWSV
jgi:uncharacterized protein